MHDRRTQIESESNSRKEGVIRKLTYNGGPLDGEERQRVGEVGGDGRERRAHDAKEKAEV